MLLFYRCSGLFSFRIDNIYNMKNKMVMKKWLNWFIIIIAPIGFISLINGACIIIYKISYMGKNPFSQEFWTYSPQVWSIPCKYVVLIYLVLLGALIILYKKKRNWFFL